MFDVFKDVPQIPKWLTEYLKDNKTDDMSLMEYGEKALEAKQVDVELENKVMAKRNQRVIPDRITMLEASILMMYRFTFRNVFTDKGHINTQLAMYIDEG